MNIKNTGNYMAVTRWEVKDGDRITWIDSDYGPVGLRLTIDVMPKMVLGHADTVLEDLALAAKALPVIWKKVQEMEGGDEQ